MKPLILHSVLAGALVAGVCLFWPSRNPPEAGNELSARPGSAASPLRTAGEKREAPKKSRVRSSPDPASDRFTARSEAIAGMQRTTEREEAIRLLAGEWAAEDSTAAERWAASFEDPADLERALTHVCLGTVDHSPAQAIRMARSHHLGDGMVETLVGRWAESDFSAASLWVDALPAGESKDALLGKLALFRAASSPEEAATMVASSMSAGKLQEEAAMSVLHQWLLKDPEAAGEWIDSFPESPLKERALHEIEGVAAYFHELRMER